MMHMCAPWAPEGTRSPARPRHTVRVGIPVCFLPAFMSAVLSPWHWLLASCLHCSHLNPPGRRCRTKLFVSKMKRLFPHPPSGAGNRLPPAPGLSIPPTQSPFLRLWAGCRAAAPQFLWPPCRLWIPSTVLPWRASSTLTATPDKQTAVVQGCGAGISGREQSAGLALF